MSKFAIQNQSVFKILGLIHTVQCAAGFSNGNKKYQKVCQNKGVIGDLKSVEKIIPQQYPLLRSYQPVSQTAQMAVSSSAC